MNEYTQKLLDALNLLEQKLDAMSNEEVVKLFEESKVTDEEASRYAILEKCILAEKDDRKVVR